MLTYATRVEFLDEEHNQAVIAVQSKMTYYRVAIKSGEITIVGPGLEEETDMEEIPGYLSYEAQGLLAVILFEQRRM